MRNRPGRSREEGDMRDGKRVTRRQFLQAASTGAAATALGLSALTAGAETRKESRRKMGTAANDKIVLGFIGVAGRGYGHLDWFGQHPDVEIGAVCDVHSPHLERAVAKTDGKAKGYHDFRKLLENKEVDAVVIATPPHWHALITLAALEAGKDVYCEKPMCRYPNEGRAMAEAAKRFKRVTQVG